MPITFNKINQRELQCFISTMAPLCFVKNTHALFLFILLFSTFPLISKASETVIVRHTFEGNVSFKLTGNSQRTTSGSGNSSVCTILPSSSSTLNLDNDSTVKAAYLYWSGSGSIDNQITFAGRTVRAPGSTTYTYTDTDDNLDYYSAKADVTSLVSNSNRNYTVSNLTFDTGEDYCDQGTSYGGWALVVIYEHPDEALRVVKVADGFENFWGESFDLELKGFIVARNPSNINGKHAHITWEGDSGNSEQRNSLSESFKFNGTGTNSNNNFNDLTGTGNPTSNQFNSYSNVISRNTSGVDIDEYLIGDYLTAGATSVITRYSSGQDYVFLTAEIISIPNEPVAELSIQQSGPTNLLRGEENTIDFTVTNNGPNTASENSEFNFAIPQGFSFVSTSSPMWNCTTTSNNLVCLYTGTIDAGSNVSLPLTFLLNNNAATSGNVNLTGTITGVLFDNILSNNTTTESYVVGSSTTPTLPTTGNKWLYLDTTSNSLTRDRNRIDTIGTFSYQTISSNNFDSWILSPAFQSEFRFNKPEINVNLCLQVTSSFRRNLPLTLQLILKSADGVNTVIAERSRQQVNLPSLNENTEQFTFSFLLDNQSIEISPLDTLELRIINNNTSNSNFRGIRVYSKMPNNYCYVSLPAATVINVDSITAKDNSGNPITDDVPPGSEISLEAIVSDPFGSFDINSSDISATGPDGNIIFSNSQMTVLNDSKAATKTFSFSYTVPSNSKAGAFKFTVRAKEGVEGTVEHSSDFLLLVSQALPNINVSKTVEVYSDPIHGTNTAGSYSKAFPGAILTYTVSAKNTGNGTAQNNSIWISDAIPDNTYMLVKNYDDVNGQGPIKDETANTANGLSYTFGGLNNQTDDIEFSNTNGTNFNYSPVEDSEGLDKNITHFRINPKGIFQAPAAGETSKQFTIKFRVQLQ